MLGPGESILKDSTQDFVTAGDSGEDVVLHSDGGGCGGDSGGVASDGSGGGGGW